MSKTRKNYTLEFKQEAVKLAKKVGCTKAGTDGNDRISKTTLAPLSSNH